jgi:hypothetical protein
VGICAFTRDVTERETIVAKGDLMIIVREVFFAKPGMASQLARTFQEMMKGDGAPERNTRVMTDMTGKFNKVVMETEYEDLAEFDRDMQEYAKQVGQKKPAEKPKHVEMYVAGKREIFRVW